MTVLPALIVAMLWAVVVSLVQPVPATRRCRRLAKPPAAPTASAGTTGDLAAARVAAVLDVLAAALDAGLAPVAALAVVAPVMPEPTSERLSRASSMLDLSSDTAAVWHFLAADDILGPLARALQRSERSGSPVAASLRGLADECRRDDRSRRIAAAKRVGIRTTVPLGACFLPAFFLVAIVPTVIALVGATF